MKNFKMVAVSLSFLIIGGILVACGQTKKEETVKTTTEITTEVETTEEESSEITIEETTEVKNDEITEETSNSTGTTDYDYNNITFHIPNYYDVSYKTAGMVCSNPKGGSSIIIRYEKEDMLLLTKEYYYTWIMDIEHFRNSQEDGFDELTEEKDGISGAVYLGHDDKNVYSCVTTKIPDANEFIAYIFVCDLKDGNEKYLEDMIEIASTAVKN